MSYRRDAFTITIEGLGTLAKLKRCNLDGNPVVPRATGRSAQELVNQCRTGLTKAEAFHRLVDWAAEYGFTMDRQVVRFGAGKREEFIIELENDFAAWGKGKKLQSP